MILQIQDFSIRLEFLGFGILVFLVRKSIWQPCLRLSGNLLFWIFLENFTQKAIFPVMCPKFPNPNTLLLSWKANRGGFSPLETRNFLGDALSFQSQTPLFSCSFYTISFSVSFFYGLGYNVSQFVTVFPLYEEKKVIINTIKYRRRLLSPDHFQFPTGINRKMVCR